MLTSSANNIVHPSKVFGQVAYPLSGEHALSVSFPSWKETEAHLKGQLPIEKAGYHRCTLHQATVQLFKEFTPDDARSTTSCFAFPSLQAAQECVDFIKQYSKDFDPKFVKVQIERIHKKVPELDLFLVVGPTEYCEELSKTFWVHSGENVSSRFSQQCLDLLAVPGLNDHATKDNIAFQLWSVHFTQIKQSGIVAKDLLKQRLAEYVPNRNITAEDVFLFPCGMSAIYNCHKLIMSLFPKTKTVQFGFSYIDTIKVQEKFGSGYYFIANSDEEKNFKELEALLETSPEISAIYAEFPANPLLRSVDLERLSILSRKYGVVLIVDNSISSINVDLFQFADIVVTSLTKFFSGDNNVMGGSLIFNPASTSVYSKLLRHFQDKVYVDNLWYEDAIVLEANSRTLVERMDQKNKTAEVLVDYLVSHEKVEQVYYPKFIDKEKYETCKIRGYGAVFSFLLKNRTDATKFFDSLDLCKGPSFGTSFTLVCPYTFLSHYSDLEWAEKHGVSKYIIRVSVGMEEQDFVVNVFKKAFSQI